MDLSALIFVALAVAWAVYLIPKALKHHEVDGASRPVESFSDRVRVLARREASSDEAKLVVGHTPRRPAPVLTDGPELEVEEDKTSSTPPSRQQQHTPTVAARAARRRRRVLAMIVAVNAVTVGLAAAGIIEWTWLAAPVALLVIWLVACRLMVKKERAVRTAPVRKRRTAPADETLADEDMRGDGGAHTDEIPAVSVNEAAETPSAPAELDGWDPVPVTLPTYVAKATAGRSVRTIDLDSTGVWSSGRNAADSALAREASARRTDEPAPDQRRASGA